MINIQQANVMLAGVIRAAVDLRDYELAHMTEDVLHQAVLAAVASGHPQSMDLAAIAMKTLENTFPRWSA